MDSLEQMRAFAAVVAAGSFTAAAARLGTTPQLVSKYVQALEAGLGARLLNRTTRKVRLTETGRAYHPRCLRLLEDYDELRRAVGAAHGRPEGRLTITALVTFGEHVLTDLVHAYAAAYPAVDIELKLTDRYLDLVDAGIDVAVRIGSLADSSLVARRLGPAPLVCCAAPSYLAGKGEPGSPADLAEHACIVDTNFRSGEPWPFVVAGERRPVAVKGRFRVNSAAAVRRLALAGDGIALCPRFVVEEDLGAGRLTAILEPFTPSNLGLYAVYPATRHLAAKVRTFVDFLAARLR